MLAKIAISLPGEMLSEISDLAQQRRVSRSALIRESLVAFLREERRRRTLARARELYAEIATEDAALAEAYQPVIAETVPPYRVEGADE